jgi:hypothetical protein
MLTVMSDDLILVSFTVQMGTDHKKDWMPNCDDFNGRNCMNER